MHDKHPEKTDSAEQHLATEHLLTNLKARTVSSSFFTAGAQFTKFALTLGSTIALSRLLTPQDFGLVAMVMTFTGFLRVFKDAGLSIATVQREKITHAQVSNLFWINVSLSGATSLVVAAAAPAVAWFYRDPRLVAVTLALSGTFLLTGGAVQHMAILNRQMRFKAIALIEVTATLASVAVGVVMAYFGFGYWSLVGVQLSLPGLVLILTWFVSRWRPRLPSRHSGTRSLVRFGADLTASSLITSFAGGADSLLIGRFCGPDPVGLYSRAGALVRRPLEQLLTPINSVFVPVLSRMQDQSERYQRTFLRVYRAVILASFLFVGVCLPLSRPLTLVVLGEKWEDVTAIFAGFILAALFNPLAVICGCLFESQGRGRDFLIANTIISLVSIGSFLAGLPYGPAGVAIAYAISCVTLQMPIYYFMAGRSGPVTTSALWGNVLIQLPVLVAVAAATFLSHRFLAISYTPLVQLSICAPVGLIAFGVAALSYPPARETVMSLFELGRDFLKNRTAPVLVSS